MFYEGTLQDGISTAVDQQKLVLCFVTDESDESTTWENDFLTDEALIDLVNDQSIALRLKAGSDEAGYLAQIFPLPRTPTVVIIKNGELKEYITPGTSKEDFIRRVQTSFSATSSSTSTTTQTQPAAVSTPQPEVAAAASSSTPPAVSSSGESETAENVRRILAERAAKLKAQKEEAERKAKEERAKKAQARAEADAGADPKAKADNENARKAVEAAKSRRQQQEEERRRILKRIEDDKAERKMRAADREAQRAEGLKAGDVAASLVNAPESKLPSTTKLSGMTALQVRLFDGTTLRSRFKTEAPLKEVRSWVDENRKDGSQPYTFKQVLTPLPNKTIDETEEAKSVGELGLSPSSTLVLIPVKSYSSAYDGAQQGLVARFIALVMGFFTWILSLFGSSEGRGASGGEAATSDEDSQEASQDRSRIQGFQNPNDRRRDQQLYNGNSLNFEPRPDEEGKED